MSQADWDRLQHYSLKVKFFSAINTDLPKVHSSTYVRIAQLQSSALFPSLRHLHYNLDDKSIPRIFLFLFLSPLLESLELSNIGGIENTIVGPFLANLSSPMLNRIVLNSGLVSADILKISFVHFKLLRSLELTVKGDFDIWEVLGTLPSLADLTLKAIDPASHSTHASENSDPQSPKYFEALESLSVTSPFFLIQYLLNFINSPYLKTIKVYPVINHINRRPFSNEHVDNLFAPSVTIVTSKWSQSLKNLVIDSSGAMHLYAVPKCLALLTDFQEMETFRLSGWKMENMDDDLRRLVMSWPKLRTLEVTPFDQTFISLSTLRIIAESCPELRHLNIQLDTSNIPPFNTSSKGLDHKLEDLSVARFHPFNTRTLLECQIQMAQHLDLIFPHLKSIVTVQPNPPDVTWSGIRDLVKLCQNVRRRQTGQ